MGCSNFLSKKKKVFLNSLRRKRAVFCRSVFLSCPSRLEFVVRLFSNNIVITLYKSNGSPVYSISSSSLKRTGNRRSKVVADILAKKVFEYYSSTIEKKDETQEKIVDTIPVFNCHNYHGIRRIAYESFCSCFTS